MSSRREEIKWVNGEPVPVNAPPLTKSQIAAIIPAAAAMPYQPTVKRNDWDEEEAEEHEKRFQREDGTWLSKYEVAQHRRMDLMAKGDTQVLKEVEDRILGKPMQQVQSFAVTATFESLMLAMAENEKGYKPPELPDYMVEIPISESDEVLDVYAKIPVMAPIYEDDDCPV